MASPTHTAVNADTASRYELAVDDMTCQHCVARVEKAALAVEGVRKVDVDLEAGLASVTGGRITTVIEAISEAGYPARAAQQPARHCDIPAGMDEARPPPPDSFRITIEEMSCASCVARVENAIRSVAGVSDAAVNLVEGAAYVVGGNPADVARAVSEQGYPARPETSVSQAEITLRFDEALSEAQRARADALLQAVGLQAAPAWQNDRQCSMTPARHPAACLLALRQAGINASIVETVSDPYRIQAQQARQGIQQSFRRALVAGSVGFGLMFGMMTDSLPLFDTGSALTDLQGRGFWLVMAVVCLATMAYSGRNYYFGAWKQARHGQTNMDTLVAVGTGAAWLASLLLILFPGFVPQVQQHLYLETSVLILAFLQFGHALEVRAKANTGRAIGALIELAPKTAQLLFEGHELEIPVSLLQPGDIIQVRPGQQIASDGSVIEGRSNVDESMLSGESLPVVKQAGDSVTGGTFNQTGQLKVRVQRVGNDTTLAGIIQAVKQAQMSKPPIGRLVDRIAAIFVPVVLVIAVVTFAAWSLVGPEPHLPYALTTAIAVLVIACPCALGLATPIAVMVGMGRAAQLGVLIRNGEALQTAAGITHLVVDKTGTLTEGRPRVTDIACLDGIDEQQALQWAASLEQASEHPLGQAVVQSAQERGITLLTPEDFHSEAGQGVSARIDSLHLLIGREEWLADQGIQLDAALRERAQQFADTAMTPVWLSDDKQALGVLGLRDPVRGDTQAAITALLDMGIEPVMCTGDHPATARAVAAELGIRSVHSRVLPTDKADIVKQLQQQGKTVGMVGDGINDAPALAQAHVGFAIGSGTDIAIESADVTLASNSLASIASAIALSRATLGNIKQNLFGAFIYNTLGIPLAAGLLYPFTGWLLSPVFASAAMALSSVTVVSNANRLRLFKPVE